MSGNPESVRDITHNGGNIFSQCLFPEGSVGETGGKNDLYNDS